MHILTPYSIEPGMPADESTYNYLHSCTRIMVECAFGLYKGKFKIFRAAMTQHTPEAMADIIKATMVLHHMMINFGDKVDDQVEIEDWMYVGNSQWNASREE